MNLASIFFEAIPVQQTAVLDQVNFLKQKESWSKKN